MDRQEQPKQGFSFLRAQIENTEIETRIAPVASQYLSQLWIGARPGVSIVANDCPSLSATIVFVCPLNEQLGLFSIARDRFDHATMGWLIHDATLRHLANCLAPHLCVPSPDAEAVVRATLAAVAAHIDYHHISRNAASAARGGLASWQQRCVRQIMLTRLDEDHSLAELAAACRFSVSHFTRAFRQTHGMSPHRWLLHRRAERAKELLRSIDLPLVDVAIQCGFADQSHFTRVFAKLVGTAPGAWRRRYSRHDSTNETAHEMSASFNGSTDIQDSRAVA